MTSSDVIVRRATPADLEAFAPGDVRPTVKAWVGEIDGKIVGLGGLAFIQGRWMAFCELSEEARRHKRAIVRGGRDVIYEARRAGHRFIYAKAAGNEPMARRWLETLGFQPGRKTGLYRWQV